MENPCSIFVGSLSADTTDDSLKEYFKKFGEIDSAVVVQDRGFGFVNFSTPDSRNAALASRPHYINNKQVESKVAIRNARKSDMGMGMGLGMRPIQSMEASGGGGGGSNPFPMYNNQEKKVFIGGIPNGTTDDDIKAVLCEFGTVTSVDQKYDTVSKRMRGFGFVEFSEPVEAQTAISTHFVTINGKSVEIKIAENRQAAQLRSPGYASSFGNNVGMYGQPMGFGTSYNYQPSTTSYSSGASPGFMGSTPSGYGGNQGFAGNSQYQSYGTKDTTGQYGNATGYTTGSSYGGGTSSGYGSGNTGYTRGGYGPYGQ